MQRDFSGSHEIFPRQSLRHTPRKSSSAVSVNKYQGSDWKSLLFSFRWLEIYVPLVRLNWIDKGRVLHCVDTTDSLRAYRVVHKTRLNWLVVSACIESEWIHAFTPDSRSCSSQCNTETSKPESIWSRSYQPWITRLTASRNARNTSRIELINFAFQSTCPTNTSDSFINWNLVRLLREIFRLEIIIREFHARFWC